MRPIVAKDSISDVSKTKDQSSIDNGEKSKVEKLAAKIDKL
jgi:hypothetical protein